MKNVSASQTFINEHAPELFSKIHNKMYFQQSKSGECRFLDGEREGWGDWVGWLRWDGETRRGATGRGATWRGVTRRRACLVLINSLVKLSALSALVVKKITNWSAVEVAQAAIKTKYQISNTKNQIPGTPPSVYLCKAGMQIPRHKSQIGHLKS